MRDGLRARGHTAVVCGQKNCACILNRLWSSCTEPKGGQPDHLVRQGGVIFNRMCRDTLPKLFQSATVCQPPSFPKIIPRETTRSCCRGYLGNMLGRQYPTFKLCRGRGFVLTWIGYIRDPLSHKDRPSTRPRFIMNDIQQNTPQLPYGNWGVLIPVEHLKYHVYVLYRVIQLLRTTLEVVQMKQKVGFIGLGVMGRPMALNLMKAGYSLSVFDINQEAVDKMVLLGATRAASPSEVGEKNDVIFTMVPNSAHVKEVVLGENGIIQGATEGAVIIDMSSISPVVSMEIAREVVNKGMEMLDAPVSGGEPRAIDGTLAIMVGGKQEVFEKIKAILNFMGENVTLVGGNGAGCTAKLANQIMVNLNIAAMSEALVFAAKAGLDVERMYEAIRGGLAGSAVLDAKVPLILERNFTAGGSIHINLKDISNVIETAHDIGVPLPLTSQLLEILHALRVDGKASDDHAGIVQYYEKLASVQVKKNGATVSGE